MYKLAFFVPSSHVETVKEALFSAGAGRIGNYDKCSWQVLGQGQFRALEGADPFLGKVGKVETVEEYKVEMVCDEPRIHAAIDALKNAHPYEEPAYEVWKIEDL